MNKLMNKKLTKKGFTLAELLIVVAILAILVAVSIPIFTAQLEKSREATDLANLRAAYAAGTAAYLDNEAFTGGWYNVGTGAIVATKTDTVKAGKGTTAEGSASNAVTIGGFAYTPGTAYTDQYIQVSVNGSTISVAFVA